MLPVFSKIQMPFTVLSRASAHGRSQLKRQKLRVGGYTEEGAWMVQISPCKGSHRMRSKLPGCTALSLRPSSRSAR